MPALDKKTIIENCMAIGHSRSNAHVIADLADDVIQEVVALVQRKLDLAPPELFRQTCICVGTGLQALGDLTVQTVIEMGQANGFEIRKI